MSQIPTLRITINDVAPPIQREFSSSFRIGRADTCDISLKHEYVSRQHVEVSFKDGQWWVEDLQSSNGMFLDGNRVTRTQIGRHARVRLGIAGPFLLLEAASPPPTPIDGDRTTVERYIQRYFSGKTAEGEGEHTVFLRRAAAKVQARERNKYRWLLAGLAIVLLAAAGYAWRVNRQLAEQKSSAQDLFYNMKSLDVDIGNLQRLVQGSAYQGAGVAEIQKYRSRRVDLERSYDRFLATLKVYDPKLKPEQKLIMRVARIFGECELDMPKDFEAEIHRYIKRWQANDRLSLGIQKAKANGYIKPITDQLLAEGLPPQFLYLALQESGFEPYSSGPETPKGIAKAQRARLRATMRRETLRSPFGGRLTPSPSCACLLEGVWQFIPETALKYGLHLGPLVDMRRPDPGDDRHHFDKETKAARRAI